jgi:hypothetical protein
MRWKKDEIDQWCEQWAHQRRKMLGLSPLEPKDRIGKLNSTLGAVREEGEGASQGTITQTFPEVYTGFALLVNRAWKEMNPPWRPVIEVHYVYGGPIKQKAHAIGIKVDNYWNHLNYAKNYIHSFVIVSTKYSSDRIGSIIATQKTGELA